MTTNITSVLNANIDMFDTTETESLAEEAQAVAEALQSEWDEVEWRESATEWLRKSMNVLMSYKEGTEEFETEWALYSDLHKDVYGCRPSRDSVEHMRRLVSYWKEHCPEMLPKDFGA